jgi:class 3 adenylate cyclase
MPLLGVALCAVIALAAAVADPPDAAPMRLRPADDYGEAGGQLLDAGWRWRAGDDPAYAATDYDDSAWIEARSWAPPRLESDPAIGWLRLRFQVSEPLQGRVLTFFVTQCGASEVYVNGARVASFGVVGATEAEETPDFADRLNRKYIAAVTATQTDQILAIRHSNTSGQVLRHAALGDMRGVAVQVFAGSPNAGVASFTTLVHTLARYQTFQVVVASAFAFLHLLLFVFYPQLRENLYFAVFAAAYALALALAIPTYGWPDTPLATLAVSRASQSAVLLACLTGCHFLYRMFGAQKTTWARVVLAFAAIATAVGWLLPPAVTNVIALVLLAEMVRLSVVALLRRRERVWIVGAGALAFAASGLVTRMPMFRDRTSLALSSLDVGLVALMGSMSVYLSQGFARTHRALTARTRELETLNVELEGRVVERTAQLATANTDLEVRNQFIQRVFGRYLSEEIVDTLLESPDALNVGGEKRSITILMSDLRGFSTLSERLPPEQVVKLLNNYLGAMTDVIVAHDGTIDEFIGDAILVFFGAPILRHDDCARAVACAVAMQRAMADVNVWNAANDLPEIQMGIAVNRGDVVVGNIGSMKRAKYAAVGAQVNLASRIQSYAAGGEIVVTESVLPALVGLARVVREDTVTPKGVRLPVTISWLEPTDAV